MTDVRRINYPAFDAYVLIDRWLMDLEKVGKVLDSNLPVTDPRMITRFDVGRLNTAIRELVEDRNP
jgi:hypothetical protein